MPNRKGGERSRGNVSKDRGNKEQGVDRDMEMGGKGQDFEEGNAREQRFDRKNK